MLERACPDCGSTQPPMSRRAARRIRPRPALWVALGQPTATQRPPRMSGRRWSTPVTCAMSAACSAAGCALMLDEDDPCSPTGTRTRRPWSSGTGGRRQRRSPSRWPVPRAAGADSFAAVNRAGSGPGRRSNGSASPSTRWAATRCTTSSHHVPRHPAEQPPPAGPPPGEWRDARRAEHPRARGRGRLRDRGLTRGWVVRAAGPGRGRASAISYIPLVLEIELTPDLVLIGLLPPLLYAAAIRTSLVDFSANRRSILLLSVGLVAFTTSSSGCVAWCAAARGHLAAGVRDRCRRRAARRRGRHRRRPTDGHAAADRDDPRGREPGQRRHGAGRAEHRHRRDHRGGQRLARRLGLRPGRRRRHRWSGCRGRPGSALVRRHVDDPVLDTTLSFVAPYVAFLPAEEVHSSGVLAVVVTGLLLGHKAPVLQTAGRASPRTSTGARSRSCWRTPSSC